MKLNKKGFTLVELLAVIVVLAIIALIGYTVVGDTLVNAQLGADARSAEAFASNLEQQCMMKKTLDTTFDPTTAANATIIIELANNSTKNDKPSTQPTGVKDMFSSECEIDKAKLSEICYNSGKSKCTPQTDGSWTCIEATCPAS